MASVAADQASSSSSTSSKGSGRVLTAGTITMDTGATDAGGGGGNAADHQGLADVHAQPAELVLRGE